MRFSSTTVLYARGHLGEALEELSHAGYSGVELQPHHTRVLMADEEERARFREALSRHGQAVAAVMSGYLWDEATAHAHLLAIDLAAELGCDRIVVLPPQSHMADLGRFQRLLLEVAEVASDHGVRLAVHHHAGTVIDTAPKIDAFLGSVAHPSVGLCFDTAHYALFADDEVDAVEKLAGRISHVHLKDLVCRASELAFVPDMLNGQQSFRVPGDGVLDLAACLRVLRDLEYDGWVSVELENFSRARLESLEVALAFAKESCRG